MRSLGLLGVWGLGPLGVYFFQPKGFRVEGVGLWVPGKFLDRGSALLRRYCLFGERISGIVKHAENDAVNYQDDDPAFGTLNVSLLVVTQEGGNKGA